MLTETLVVSAVCFRDAAGRVLMVRKRGTDHFMLPGGKLEPGETPTGAALREVREEIGVEISLADIAPLCDWTGPVANEADTSIAATVFVSKVSVSPAASGEIAELLWIDPTDARQSAVRIAPLLLDSVFPALLARAGR